MTEGHTPDLIERLRIVSGFLLAKQGAEGG
jgi:hypothetical protein